jgi:hypothetical protein
VKIFGNKQRIFLITGWFCGDKVNCLSKLLTTCFTNCLTHCDTMSPPLDVFSEMSLNWCFLVSVFEGVCRPVFFLGFLGNWLLRFFPGQFSGNTNSFQSKSGENRKSERSNTILETLSFQGNKIWINELSVQERVCNQWHLNVKIIQYKDILVAICF